MTVSSIATSTNMLTILAQASQNATQLSVQVESDQATSGIEKQLQQKIAALSNSPSSDDILVQVSQSQLKALNTQFATVSTRSSQFSANGNVLTDINHELAALQTDIKNSDSANFDTTLSAIHDDIGNLIVAPPTAPFQPDQILQIKTNGLTISSSGTYNLSTPAGQAAAQNDVSNAQQYINQLLTITTSNQVVAASLANGLSSQIDALNQAIIQTQTNSQNQIADQTAQLTQLAHDQENLIQLALGNTTQLSSELATMATISNPPSSPFDVLSNAVGATASSITPADSSSSVLSIFA